MNPKYWWSLSIIAMSVIAVLAELTEATRFDPESLPPPAAGVTSETVHTQNTCDGITYSISQDGIKYVRESGGGALLAASVGNKIGYYQLGRFWELEQVNRAEIDDETLHMLDYALTSCDARYNPSGVYFALK